MDEDDLSRILSGFFCGDDSELFSSRCYRLRWTSIKWFALHWIVNDHFWRKRQERGHCRAAWLRERAERAEPPDRARMAGL